MEKSIVTEYLASLTPKEKKAYDQMVKEAENAEKTIDVDGEDKKDDDA